jgi:hypothetical protein
MLDDVSVGIATIGSASALSWFVAVRIPAPLGFSKLTS